MPVLTDRERDVLGLMGLGHTVARIAERLQMSTHTVADHKRSIYAKLGVGNQSHAVSRAITLGLFDDSGVQPVPAAPGRAGLVVVHGPSGACLDDVTQTLLARDEPFIAALDCDTTSDGWVSREPGRVATVLVDPDHAAWKLAARLGAPTVVVHSTPPDIAFTVTAIRRGAYALVSQCDVREGLCAVLALARHGYRILSPANVQLLAGWLPSRVGRGTPVTPTLTCREHEILLSIGRGHTVVQTARSLGIAVKTVENIQTRLFRKMGTRNRAETLVAAHRAGLLDG